MLNSKFENIAEREYKRWLWYYSRFPNSPETVNRTKDKTEEIKSFISRSRRGLQNK